MYDPFNPQRGTLLWGFFNYPNALGRFNPYLGCGEQAIPLATPIDQSGHVLLPYAIRITRFWERQRYRVAASGVATNAYLRVNGVDVATLAKPAAGFDSTTAMSRIVPAGILIAVQWEQLVAVPGGYAPIQAIDYEVLQ